MYPVIAHLYGPLNVNSYGTAILIGVLIFLWLTYHHKERKKLLTQDDFYNLILINIIAGIIGGRLLFIISAWKSFSTWTELFELWDGGFSILGTLIGIIIASTFYFKKNHIPALKVFDLIALNAAIMQAFGRIGCFFAGCCYGMPTTAWWGITFMHPEGLAPLCVRLLPTQLMSAASFFLIFLLMHLFKSWCHKPGQLVTLYVILASFERFIGDFWRAERTVTLLLPSIQFSLHQWIALCMFSIALIGFLFFTFKSKKSA
ncbi:MAG: prolipoprotein diacylglyceryl transferase family protein [Candidatus Babeliaceae bacterium]